MIHRTAVVDTPHIGENTVIGEFAVVRAGARLGRDVVVHPHVVIGDGVDIGDGCEIFPGAFLGKEPKGAGATARAAEFSRHVRIGAGCSIGPHAVIFYDVEIGDHTLLGDGASIREQGRIGSRCILSRYVTLNYNVRVGDRVKIMDLTHITGNTTIADDAFVSTGVFTTNDNALGAHGFTEGQIVGPTLHEGAMVGAGAVLLPGVVVGAGAIVGAGSVLTKSVEPGMVAMGVPARPIKRRS